jgi:hypothetical protein
MADSQLLMLFFSDLWKWFHFVFRAIRHFFTHWTTTIKHYTHFVDREKLRIIALLFFNLLCFKWRGESEHLVSQVGCEIVWTRESFFLRRLKMRLLGSLTRKEMIRTRVVPFKWVAFPSNILKEVCNLACSFLVIEWRLWSLIMVIC